MNGPQGLAGFGMAAMDAFLRVQQQRKAEEAARRVESRQQQEIAESARRWRETMAFNQAESARNAADRQASRDLQQETSRAQLAGERAKQDAYDKAHFAPYEVAARAWGESGGADVGLDVLSRMPWTEVRNLQEAPTRASGRRLTEAQWAELERGRQNVSPDVLEQLGLPTGLPIRWADVPSLLPSVIAHAAANKLASPEVAASLRAAYQSEGISLLPGTPIYHRDVPAMQDEIRKRQDPQAKAERDAKALELAVKTLGLERQRAGLSTTGGAPTSAPATPAARPTVATPAEVKAFLQSLAPSRATPPSSAPTPPKRGVLAPAPPAPAAAAPLSSLPAIEARLYAQLDTDIKRRDAMGYSMTRDEIEKARGQIPEQALKEHNALVAAYVATRRVEPAPTSRVTLDGRTYDVPPEAALRTGVTLKLAGMRQSGGGRVRGTGSGGQAAPAREPAAKPLPDLSKVLSGGSPFRLGRSVKDGFELPGDAYEWLREPNGEVAYTRNQQGERLPMAVKIGTPPTQRTQALQVRNAEARQVGSRQHWNAEADKSRVVRIVKAMPGASMLAVAVALARESDLGMTGERAYTAVQSLGAQDPPRPSFPPAIRRVTDDAMLRGADGRSLAGEVRKFLIEGAFPPLSLEGDKLEDYVLTRLRSHLTTLRLRSPRSTPGQTPATR